MKIISLLLVIVSFLNLSPALAAPPPAAATANSGTSGSSIATKKGKIVVKSAIYGLAGGLVVGLASQVFKKKARNVFMFGSLGMYAGIALGIYVISTTTAPKPYEGPDTYEDFTSGQVIEPSSTLMTFEDKNKIEMNLVSLSF